MRWLLAACLVALSAVINANAEESGGSRLGELKSKGATQLSKEELETLLPGAKVENLAAGGSTRYWENEASGKFIASTNRAGSARGGPFGKTATARGTWHIGDDGTYCVVLEWSQRTEQWCRYMFRLGDRYYGVKSLENMAGAAHEFSFSR